MIKEFAFIGAILSMYSATPSINKNFQHTEEIAPNTEVTYKYESNEVNSIDDLNFGYIYNLNSSYDKPLFDLVEEGYLEGVIINVNHFSISTGTFDFDEFVNDSSIAFGFNFYAEANLITLYASLKDMYFSIVISLIQDDFDFDFVLLDFDNLWESGLTNYISYTDYNEIVSVEYIPPKTFIGVINEFCETYLFSEIPYINQIQFTVGGQQISMMTYCVIFVGLATAIGLLILLFVFLKWLFYLFGGCFHIRK